MDIGSLPTVRIGDWVERTGAAVSKSSNRSDRDAGIVALATDAPALNAARLDVLPLAEWEQRKSEFVYATWLQRASQAAGR
jgi:hypothetical protein